MALRRLSPRRRLSLTAVVVAVWLGVSAPPAHADIVRGIGYILAGVLEIPRQTIGNAMNPPIIGAVFGALGGTLRGLGLVTRGTLEVVSTAIPMAIKLAPLIPLAI